MLRFKADMFLEPYTKFVYCSPNLAQTFLPHEQRLLNELRQLAEPASFECYPHLPSTDDIYGFVENEQSRILLLIDDWNEVGSLY